MRGEITENDVKILELVCAQGPVHAAVRGAGLLCQRAGLIATDRGIEAALVTDADAGDHRNLVRVRLALTDGTSLSVGGTLSGPRNVPSWWRSTTSTSRCRSASTW